jgi:hypothetical protein
MSAAKLLAAGLPAMRAVQPGPVTLARLLWHTQRAESDLARGRFEASWDHLWRVGQALAPHTPSAEAWQELALVMLEVCLRGALKPQLAETLEQYGWLAWREGSGEPWGALGLIGACEEAGTWSTGAHLGDLLARQWPACAAGATLAGHFRELELLASGELGGARMRAAASRFERALELATQAGRPELVARLGLRAGVALMLEGKEKGRGRALLRGIDAERLGRGARLWYAVGMARSDFWLDRVRAADMIDEVAAKTAPEDLEGRQELAALLRFLLSQETLAMMPAEEDRLDALIKALAEPDERAKLRDLMELKRLLTEQGKLEPGAAAEVSAQLAKMSAAYGGAWQALSMSYQRFIGLLDASAALGPAPRDAGRAAVAPLTLLAQEVLHATRVGGVPGAIGAVQYALTTMEASLGAARSAELRPLVAIWPALLGALEAAAADEGAKEQREHLQMLTARLFALWVERAPTPTSGWWLLSAHMARAGLLEGAELAAQRAWGAGEQGDEAARGFASGKILEWVIGQGEPARMLRWLERMEPGAANV